MTFFGRFSDGVMTFFGRFSDGVMTFFGRFSDGVMTFFDGRKINPPDPASWLILGTPIMNLTCVGCWPKFRCWLWAYNFSIDFFHRLVNMVNVYWAQSKRGGKFWFSISLIVCRNSKFETQNSFVLLKLGRGWCLGGAFLAKFRARGAHMKIVYLKPISLVSWNRSS